MNEVSLEGRGGLSLACDWGVGIGGGLWSTGLLLIEHLCKNATLYDGILRGKRVLELGSGTGLVGETTRSRHLTVSTIILTRTSTDVHYITRFVCGTCG